MGKTLYIHREGTVSVAQMPHEDGGYTHLLASPSPRSILYYVGHRPNRRTKKMTILHGGFRSVTKAFEVFYRSLKIAKLGPRAWDPMGGKVQKWEAEFVDPHFKNERLSRDQMLSLLYRVCAVSYTHLTLPTNREV